MLAAAGTALALSAVPALALAAYPLRLLLTLVHELGHGLAALVTGGEFLRFVVFPDGSGLAYTAGGLRLLVIPAGYLGVAAFGAALLVAGSSRSAGRWALGTVGAAVVVLTLRYGLPTLFSTQALAGLLTLVTGLALGSALVWIAVRAAAGATIFALHLLAFQAGLTAFADLRTLVGLTANLAPAGNDAVSMAEITPLPAVVWAVLWAVAAVLVLAAGARLAWSR